MAAGVKYEVASENILEKVHDFQAAGDTCKLALTNTAPNVATHTILANITEIAAGNGYTAGGDDVQQDTSRTGGTTSVTGVDVTWTASGGSIGPFRYIVLYNDTPTSPADPLICYWDYGSNFTITDGNSFTANIGASLFTLA